AILSFKERCISIDSIKHPFLFQRLRLTGREIENALSNGARLCECVNISLAGYKRTIDVMLLHSLSKRELDHHLNTICYISSLIVMVFFFLYFSKKRLDRRLDIFHVHAVGNRLRKGFLKDVAQSWLCNQGRRICGLVGRNNF